MMEMFLVENIPPASCLLGDIAFNKTKKRIQAN